MTVTDILEKFHELVDVIQNYESDTFSALGHDLTKSEAKQIAKNIFMGELESLISCYTLDGLRLTEELLEIRTPGQSRVSIPEDVH